MSEYASWGRCAIGRPRLVQQPVRVDDIVLPGSGPVLAFGNGRSYGDVGQNDDGTLIDLRALDRELAFDEARGVLEVEAGTLLSTIIQRYLPRGWGLPVTPGTAFVTVGGAIANDVHGKNHHKVGSFGHHVLSIDLLRSDGQVRRCSPEQDAELFAATVGGLGLTGLVLRARLQLRPMPGGWLVGRSERFGALADFFALSAEADADSEYTVAWLDCLAGGASQGRGIFMRANHDPDPAPLPARRALRMPFTPPVCPINKPFLKLFNTLYYHRPAAQQARARWDYHGFFHPLDGIREWNRMYGPRGFFQFQCVVPAGEANAVLGDLLGLISRSGQGSFLAVLKMFGDLPSRGMLSFPRPGATLALDFPDRGDRTGRLMKQLEHLVREAGGAIYPAKDAWMGPDAFRQFYPRMAEFSAHVDPAFSSTFWRRVNA